MTTSSSLGASSPAFTAATARSGKPVPEGFRPPAYPYDRLAPIAELARAHQGGLVDCSIGTPCDPPSAGVVAALASSGTERGYPPGAGSKALRDAAVELLERRFRVVAGSASLAACIGTKELVAGLPHWLRLRSPRRDTVLYPAISYPTYAIGAKLAGARAVPVPPRPDGSLDLDAIREEDVARALCLWVNSPSNPTGALDDLDAAARFGRERGLLVCSDECYAELTLQGRPRSVLETGSSGVLALHSLSKRSNAAGLRVGFYAGDEDVVHYLSELRRHAGFMVPGPVQAAAVVALGDDEAVLRQLEVYRERLELLVAMLRRAGLDAELPAGGFYLWVRAPAGEDPGGECHGGESHGSEGPAGEGPGWQLTRALAEHGGILVSPGQLYGELGAPFVRVAAVQPIERLTLVAARLEASGWTAGQLGNSTAGRS